MFDAEGIVAGDLADVLRRHTILSRSIANAGKRRGLDRYDRAGAAFGECGGLGRAGFFQFDVCAKRSAIRHGGHP